MKKTLIFCLVVAVALCIVLTGCSGDNNNPEIPDDGGTPMVPSQTGGEETPGTPDNDQKTATDGLAFGFDESDYAYYVSGYTGTSTVVNIPAEHNDGTHGTWSVTGINGYVFCDNTNITDVTIADGVTSIGDWAFYNCTALAEITIPDSVTSIGGSAFYNTPWYTDRQDGIVYAGKVAYKYKGNMSDNASLEIAAGTISIADYAFYGSSKLSSVLLPDSVITVGQYAFANCTALAKLTMGSNVTSIGECAFYNCAALGKVLYTGTVTNWNAIDIAFENGNFTRAEIVFDYVIGSDEDASYIKPTPSDSPEWSSDGLVFSYDSDADGYLLTKYNGSASKVKIPASYRGEKGSREVIGIGVSAFSHCASVVEVSLPDTIKTIDGYAFNNCRALKSITIPDSVTSIGDSAFFECVNMLEVKFGSGLKTIGECAFMSCGLIKLNIPDNVTEIEYNAFMYCAALTKVTIGSGVTTIGNNAFHGCERLSEVFIPAGVTDLGMSVFSSCIKLASIVVDENNTEYYSAGNCVIVKENGMLLFGCNNSVIPTDGSVKSIAGQAFTQCRRLTDIVIPDGVTDIYYSAFAGCRELTTIVIPDTVKKINDEAFYDCDSLTTVYYTGTEEQWNELYIGRNNSCLTDADIVFDYSAE